MENQILHMSNFHLDVLKEISNIGAGNAATSLSQLLSKPVAMTVSQVLPLHFHEIIDYVGGADNIVTTVFLRIEGDMGGNMFFVMDTHHAHNLIENVTGTVVDNEFSEMALSVLQEMGNILSGSYLTALSDFTSFELRPSVPSLAIDMAGAILSDGLMELGRSGDYAIMIDAKITTDPEKSNKDISSYPRELGGHFFLLPDPDSFEKLFVALGVNSHGGN